ncbi:integrin alpha-6-like [Denticeps clupeoides]|uniref:integrin alpha-6-like n=1 Tax=Denticeps clupeoides TaxID=299321 RepID=UPI0010A33502|nr:integrin alpha-6-like [Denticeps clupeoides]XP_028816349.1 integrin alpha-6-like [Denticeps clupeoides]
MAWGNCLLLLFLVQCWLCRLSAFNLDTSGVLRKNGEPGSLFGFSLAMHHQLRPSDRKLLLVGAPHARALGNQRANITGGLYSCPFNSRPNDCQRVKFDEEEREEDYKENQWMGVRVQSQGAGGKVVTCAHRYQKWKSVESRIVPGRCIVLEQDLQVGKDVDEFFWDRKFCAESGRLDVDNTKNGFGYCQQGLSPAFAKGQQHLLFGAPGMYDWKGAVRLEPVVDSTDPQFLETGDENQYNPSLIPVDISSYVGFSLDSGTNLIQKGELIIVAGAPRAGYSGKVLMLKKDRSNGRRNLEVVHTLNGPGLASSFGYDLAVVDLNADGWEDIVVGAPQYFEKDGDVGGAVYVYINSAGAKDWSKQEGIRLSGNQDSMFGLAVEGIGDINQDGFQDIAVGVPYEGSGRVYLYHGSPEGIRKKPAQVLEDRGNNVKMFGYSLAGNMDIDGNEYPDLAVGSLSDAVHVFRARPVINIRKKMTITPNLINFKKDNCDKRHCMISVHSCFSYSTHPATYHPSVTIHYRMEADEERRKLKLPPRLTFESPFQSDLELLGQDKEKCVLTTLRLQSEIHDKLSGIPITVSASLLRATTQSLVQASLPNLTPVDSQESRHIQSQIMFVNTGCRSDNICYSNLALKYEFVSRQNQNSFTPLTRENGEAVITPGDKEVALQILVTNKDGEDAHQTQLSVTLPDSLSYVSYISGQPSASCSANENGTLVECHLGNPFTRDSEVTLYIILTTERISLSTKDVDVQLQLKTISSQNISAVEAKARVMFELDLQVFGLARPSQVFFGGDVKGDTAMTSEDEIGNLIQYEFRIINLGRPLKSLAAASLDIQWPKENKDGKWLLYLTQINSKGVQAAPCTPTEEIRAIKHIKATSATSRRKRQAEEGELEALSENGIFSIFGKRKHKILACTNEVRCVTMKCSLMGLDDTAVIILRARLWNSTFLEDYSSLNYLEIVVNASLSLGSAPENVGLKTSHAQVKLTVFPENKSVLYTRVPWWVIFLSVIVAIGLMVLLGYLLCKLGCFDSDKDKSKYQSINPKA